MPSRLTFLSVSLLALLTGCRETLPQPSAATPSAATPAAATSAGAASYRIRSDFTAPLNADTGWAAALNTNATVDADYPFRLRFEVLGSADRPSPRPLRLQVRRNAEAWTALETHDFPHPESDNAKTPRVSIVSCAAYAPNSATTNLLRGAAAPFQPGVGIGLAAETPAAPPAGSHTEFEWAVVIRRFADNAVTNEPSDTFEFRLTDTDAPLPGAIQNPVVRLAVRHGHVGGTFVETPGRIGPWRATNGDLYFIMEPAETSNLFMMIKSSDGGRSWREVDAAHRPPTRDLESVDARQVGPTIHILHQVTRSSRYHSFRTSDHPTHPDTWDVRGETVATATSVAQAASLVVRGDTSMVAFYVGQTKVHYAIRSPAGTWGPEKIIDADIGPNLAGPQAILGANDTVHLAYYGWDGTLWYRRLLRDGTLTPREQIASGLGTTRAEYGAVLPLVYLPSSNTVAILYRLATGRLWERRVVNDRPLSAPKQVTDRAVIQSAVDSQQPGADVVADGDTLHVLFIEQGSRSIYSTHDRGGWQPSTLRIDKIFGSWVRGNIYPRADGRKVYGYIYDAGSDGGAGMNRFAEVVLNER